VKHAGLTIRPVQHKQDGKRQTYKQISSIFRVQCKLNLLTYQFNLHKVLRDKPTNISVRYLRGSENKLTSRSIQFLRGSGEINL
jgi:hypothetical protein